MSMEEHRSIFALYFAVLLCSGALAFAAEMRYPLAAAAKGASKRAASCSCLVPLRALMTAVVGIRRRAGPTYIPARK